ncbi:LA2681 family HEPN domain-containing protein [Aeromonas eucrenophila]|uniref:LA2681 family HEPN domain-containing protein n=1 Tax=Aeromonas eucrenophila TaxID=649 RepID=A0ABW0Y7I4_9GAMM|nr:LA2681 family HEPN domain-containing protein [Aeromonas eucrenophila]
MEHTEFDQISRNLYALVDINPFLAIGQARLLEDDANSRALKACIFVDAGEKLKDRACIEDGIKIFEEMLELYQDVVDFKYNLANGYSCAAKATAMQGSHWYLCTHVYRFKARALYSAVTKSNEVDFSLKSQAYTNMANLLLSSFRWAEAFDLYELALWFDSKNAVASYQSIVALRRLHFQNIVDDELLIDKMNILAQHIHENIDSVREYAGPKAEQSIFEDIQKICNPSKPLKNKNKPQRTQYERFVLKHNLALSPAAHISSHLSDKWDELHINKIILPLDHGYSVPEIFAMLNTMKSDYILARKLLFDVLEGPDIKDTGTYIDTLDYALYGASHSLLCLCQRSALDILDKISVASLIYLGEKNVRNVSFRGAWYINPKEIDIEKKKYKQVVSNEVDLLNEGLIALIEMASDLLISGGYLVEKQDARNYSTHKFTILHDMGSMPLSPSGSVGHYRYNEFRNETLETLKLVRSALIYFVQMISFSEKIKESKTESPLGLMTLYSHDYIRGS